MCHVKKYVFTYFATIIYITIGSGAQVRKFVTSS
jgi:hypothetical protein